MSSELYNATHFQGYEPTIGLEIHCQLNTKSKLFCACPTQTTQIINKNTCDVCLGLPGSLPVLNKQATDYAVWLALALGAKISPIMVFDRKQYFYPDLPKGYQISQMNFPICLGGQVKLESGKLIDVTRAHIEEDAGKSIHGDSGTALDFNRAGTPLLEIVSEPQLKTAAEASDYFKQVYLISTFLGVCDGNLEEGSLRCDANVSVAKRTHTEQEPKKLGTRCEIKNINSFKNLERAIQYEIVRQIDTIESGKKIVQSTMGFEESTGKTFVLREKEDADDYRYFPDPDLKPIFLESKRIAALKAAMPELPEELLEKYSKKYGLSREDLKPVLFNSQLKNYFDSALMAKDKFDLLKLVHWLQGDLSYELNQRPEVVLNNISGQSLAELIGLISSGKISGKIAKVVFKEMLKSAKKPQLIVEDLGLEIVSDMSIIEKALDEVITEHTDVVEQYRSGNKKTFGFLMGRLMQKTKGKADPKKTTEALKRKLQ